ncbi:MAG: hypothetical protein DAHOPDDO_00479 [Ignavibacteriaceae bacterium]|nr:hypothetical protein [Ignavibacteriaceae bacterium]
MFSSTDTAKIFLIISIAAINFVPVLKYIKRTKSSFWILPFTPFIITYLLNYPLKTVLLLFPPIYISDISILMDYNIDDIIGALIFSTLFFFIFMAISLKLLKKIDLKSYRERIQMLLDKPAMRKIINTISALVIFISLYKIFNTSFYGLSSEYKNTTLDNIILIIYPLIYVAILFNYLLFKRKKTRLALINTLLLIAASLILSFISTAKGPLFILLFVYLIVKQLSNERFNLKLVIPVIIIFISFWYYSYASRFFGNVHDVSGFGDLRSNVELVTYSNISGFDLVVNTFFNRFELFQNLIYTIKKSDRIDKGVFVAGSAIEIVTFIPSIIWTDRPFPYFNYFVSKEILGFWMSFSSSSIGRIGEAFFILGYMGFLFGGIYALLFYQIFKVFYLKSKKYFSVLIYFNIYLLYLIHDNYFFQSAFTLVITSLLIILITSLYSKKIR